MYSMGAEIKLALRTVRVRDLGSRNLVGVEERKKERATHASVPGYSFRNGSSKGASLRETSIVGAESKVLKWRVKRRGSVFYGIGELKPA